MIQALLAVRGCVVSFSLIGGHTLSEQSESPSEVLSLPLIQPAPPAGFLPCRLKGARHSPPYRVPGGVAGLAISQTPSQLYQQINPAPFQFRLKNLALPT